MHNLLIEDRNKITITDVKDVDSFDEETINMSLNNEGLILKGKDLQIQKLDVEEGKIIVIGTINSATYTGKRDKAEGGILKRILK